MDSTERRLLDAVLTEPSARQHRKVYADWLESRGDAGAAFLRCDMALWSLEPDHVLWTVAEHELSRLRMQLDPGWLAEVETPDTPSAYHSGGPNSCPCSPATSYGPELEPPQLHRQVQDTQSSGWKRLLELIEEAAADGRQEFDPRQDLSPEQWRDIITLPKTIAKLTQVYVLTLYGSNLVRIPPEIGAMAVLHDFDPYTSYALHFYPYELRRAGPGRSGPNFRESTRAVYGNGKSEMGFPRLTPDRKLDRYWAGHSLMRRCCSCAEPFRDRGHYRGWIGQSLANACSTKCLDDGKAHLGGSYGNYTAWTPP
jgi:uncharacterized protein (TIGR02996 family)